MEAGDLFGEMPLFDGGQRSAGARALEPSEVVAVPYGPVEQILKERPELLWGVVRLLAHASARPTPPWPTRSSST